MTYYLPSGRKDVDRESGEAKRNVGLEGKRKMEKWRRNVEVDGRSSSHAKDKVL